MKRRVHIPNLYALGPGLVGPAAAVAWQEGRGALAALLGLAFAILVAGGVRAVRVHWR